MNLFVNRESPVPMHDQLVAQIGQLVASGALAPGARLPSIRGLATRLGIHHLTVLSAYRALAERGVLVIREGSGVRVAEFGSQAAPLAEVALQAAAAYFVAQARAGGHADAAIREAFAEALAPPAVTRLVVANPHPDLQKLYAFELRARIALPIDGQTPEEVEQAGAAAFADACVLTSTNFAAQLSRALGPARMLVLFRLGSTEPLMARVRALPQDALVALVSESERFVFLFGELLSAVLPEERLVRAELCHSKRATAALKNAALIVTDAASEAAVRRGARGDVLVHRLLAEEMLESLAGVLSSKPRE